MAALAIGCTVPEHAKFDRKHYSYPDLPKGYQISQYDEPIGVHGSLAVDIDGESRVIGITRLHLEEDVGKLIHDGTSTLIDDNRAGTPLVEIVTEPVIRTPAEARAFLESLRAMMRALNISNAEMEKGELRCDANISLRPVGDDRRYPKTEIKNLNSFRAVERALRFEIDRQRGQWDSGQPPTVTETRGWNEDRQETELQRTKEVEADYRYFPEPDIPPLHFTPEFLLEIRAETPELPAGRRQRFQVMYGLIDETALRLVGDPELAKYFEAVVTEFRAYMESELGVTETEARWTKDHGAINGMIAGWLINRIPADHRAVHGLGVPAADVARLLWMVYHRTVTLQASAGIFEQMRLTKKGPHTLVRELGLERVQDTAALEAVARSVIEANPDQVSQYRAGKTAVRQFFIGQVMRATKGAADAAAVREILEKLLR